MYKISAPIMHTNLERHGKENIVKELKQLDIERVLFAIDRINFNHEKFEKDLKEIAENCRYFKNQGFEVCVWTWAFWIDDKSPFINIHSCADEEFEGFACPSDKEFLAFAKKRIKAIAETGVDMIWFDDDLRYGFFGNEAGCICKNHIALINEILGENADFETISHNVLNGSKNKFRDAYLKANGMVFENFAKEMRKAVDEVNPNTRIGFCSCMTSWDIDGTDVATLAKIMAGNTKPIVRLIGAPYWAVNTQWNNRLQDVIELERMESSWIKQIDPDVEIVAEGDAFPRPRINCPASYLEGFDTAIRASGCTDGIAKYAIDYTSNPGYETGYAKFHNRNKELYKQIDKYFKNKTDCGIRVYTAMKKVADTVTKTQVNDNTNLQNLFFSQGARTLTHNTIPTTYNGIGVTGIAFDENARHLPEDAFENGLIIDATAAEILISKGIDVGIKKFGERKYATEEHFIDNGNYIAADNSLYEGGTGIFNSVFDEKIEILSDALINGEKIPMSYRYENAEGNRFLVLNFSTRLADRDSYPLLRHYERGRQYAENVEWLSGKKLPAYCYGHPSLYMLCKEDENSLSVGLWNFFADIAFEPVIELGDSYSEIEFINCSGELKGNKVFLDDIAAFGFAGFEAKK